MGQLCCSLSSFWQVLPTFPFGALELALFPERNLKPRQVFKAGSTCARSGVFPPCSAASTPEASRSSHCTCHAPGLLYQALRAVLPQLLPPVLPKYNRCAQIPGLERSGSVPVAASSVTLWGHPCSSQHPAPAASAAGRALCLQPTSPCLLLYPHQLPVQTHPCPQLQDRAAWGHQQVEVFPGSLCLRLTRQREPQKLPEKFREDRDCWAPLLLKASAG